MSANNPVVMTQPSIASQDVSKSPNSLALLIYINDAKLAVLAFVGITNAPAFRNEKDRRRAVSLNSDHLLWSGDGQ